MKLNVHVLGQHVGVLEQVGDFKSVMTYVPDVAPEKLVSLTMPVRTESYLWDDELHPIFRMNLPEGYLLQVLQEEFGPHIGASPVALLSVIGRNMVGRLKVAHREPHWTNRQSRLKSRNSSRATTPRRRSLSLSANTPGAAYRESCRNSWTQKRKSRAGLGSTRRQLSSRISTSSKAHPRGFRLPRPMSTSVCRSRQRSLKRAKTELSRRWQRARGASLRRGRKRQAIPGNGGLLCSPGTSATEQVRNHMGENRQGSSRRTWTAGTTTRPSRSSRRCC